MENKKLAKFNIKKLILAIALGLIIFGLVFLTINFPAYFLRLKYDLNPGAFNQVIRESGGDDRLIIKKINVNTPIVWNVAENEIDKRLSEGVVHYRGTALPNEKGNTFITAHSSYYFWNESPYKATFALLDKLEQNDEVLVTYQNIIYVYKVFDSQIVDPQDVSILDQTNKPILTLMTCVPIGTDLNRLAVKAKLVYSKQIE